MCRGAVLVVDDSALMRKLIPQMLAVDEAINVVGTAMDGSFCLKKIEELKPNVVTLDLEMPGMNGIDTLKEIMRHNPVPVIVFSSHSTEGASVTILPTALVSIPFGARRMLSAEGDALTYASRRPGLTASTTSALMKLRYAIGPARRTMSGSSCPAV